MRLTVTLALCAGLMLCGCSERLMQARDDYRGIETKAFPVEGEDVWRVFDRPDLGKLMITPSLAKIAVMAAARGLADPPQTTYERAAMDYLTSTGRACRLVRTELVQRPQWEIQYDCSAPLPVATARPPSRRR